MTIETAPPLVSPRGTPPVPTILFLLLVGLWAVAPNVHAQDIPPEAGKTLVDLVFATDSAFENRVEISWVGDSTNVLQLNIYRDILADPRGSTLLSLAPSLDNVFNDETGDPGVVYNYCVLATYNNNLPPDTAIDKTCAEGSRLIFPPTGLAASDGIFADRVDLSWVDESFIEAGYYVYRDPTGGPPGPTLLATLPADRIFYKDNTAVQGTSYTYCVEAFDAGDFRSDQACATGKRGFVLPPLNVTATDGQYTDRVVIAFTDQTDSESGYEIKRDDEVIVTLPVVVLGDTTYADMGGLDTSHRYCVTTLSAGGERSPEVCDDKGIGGIGTMAPPMNVTATDDDFDDRVDLAWDNPGNVEDGFLLFRDPTGGTPTTELATLSKGTKTYSDQTAEPGTEYTYCVQAFSDQGGTAPVVCANGRRIEVLAPTGLAATDGTYEDRVDLTWQSTATRASLFKIYRKLASETETTAIRTVPISQLTYSDYGISSSTLESDEDYEYCVTALGDAESAMNCDIGSRSILPPENVNATDDVHENRVRITWQDRSQIEDGYFV